MAPPSDAESHIVGEEARRRWQIWSQLRQIGGPAGVEPQVLRELGVYGGAQGVWVDKARTGNLTNQGSGVTVGLLHTGSSYADDLSDDGVIYHYPSTGRPPGRDAAEVEATKEAGRRGLPVFVISYPSRNSRVRDVRLGWVEEWDDESRQFLVTFGEQPDSAAEADEDDRPFNLTDEHQPVIRGAKVRPSQQRFKFRVFKRYGPACAVCEINHAEVLDAAHIRPKQAKGTDDPRNGLVLCANHHRAFDAGLFGIEPESLRVKFTDDGAAAGTLHITHFDLRHLPRLPHMEALTWRWGKWSRGRS